MSKRIPLLPGQKFGRLTVVSLHHISIKREPKRIRRRPYYLCECDCGKEKVVLKDNLKSGLTKSCGCFSSQLAKKRSTKHGMTSTRLYHVWISMKQRCYDKKSNSYHNYGGRGITVCNEWKNDFMSFYNWAMANGYDKKAERGECTLDRIDVNGNYEPNNCKLSNMKIQGRNKRTNRILEFDGKKHCVSEWAEIIGVSKSILFARLYRGLSIEEALSGKYLSYNKNN